jgi:hypothetical protein
MDSLEFFFATAILPCVNEAAKHTFPSHEHGTLVEGNVLVKLTSKTFFSWRDWIPRPLQNAQAANKC